MINGAVSGQRLKLTYTKIVADTIDYLTAAFTFSPEWSGLTKWAHFAHDMDVYDIALESDKVPKSAHLNLSAGTWTIYLHGNELVGETVVERITTEVRQIYVVKTGTLDGAVLPEIPATAAEQLDAKVSNAMLVAQGVRDDAATGNFDGEDGGYYTPDVSESGTLSWTASKDGMPAVDVANVKGPRGEIGATGPQGPQGIQGETGQDGYTPVRGTDYWTDTDKQEIVTKVEEVSELRGDLNATNECAFIASLPITDDIEFLGMESHKYTAISQANWQNGSFLTFSNLTRITGGVTFHVGRYSGDCFGNQPCIITFFDSEGNIIDSKTIGRTSLNAKGGFNADYTAPEGTAYTNIQFAIVSNASAHQLPTVGTTYRMTWCYVYVGDALIEVDYSMLTNQAKKFSLAVSGVNPKLPNYDTSTKKMTLYSGLILRSHDGTIFAKIDEDTELTATETSNNNVFVFNTNTNTFQLLRFGANLSNSPYIILGEINIYNGKGSIQCGYTIDGYPVGAESLISKLPSAWSNRIQEIQTAQGKKFTFAIQTDTHYSSDSSVVTSSINEMKYFKILSNYIGFDFMANLGDLIQGYTDDTNDNMRIAITEALKAYTTDISCPFMIAMGNHDRNTMYANAHGIEPLSFNEVWGRMFKPAFNTNPKANTQRGLMYYYTDFDDVRVIVLNTQDGIDGAFSIGETQLTWFISEALNTNKAILVMSHVPLVDGWSIASNYDASYANVVTALKSFMSNNGVVIGCLSGHLHKQESKLVDGINYIVFNYQTNRAEVVQVDLDNKTINTFMVGSYGSDADRNFIFN